MSSRDAFLFSVVMVIDQTLVIVATLYALTVALRHWHVGRSARLAAAGFGLAVAVQATLLALIVMPVFGLQPEQDAGLGALFFVGFAVGWAGVAAAVLIALALRRAWRGETLVSRLDERFSRKA